MPRQIGQALRYFAARISDSSCVLSPISASATVAVEIRNVCMMAPAGWEGDRRNGSLQASRPGHRLQETKGLAGLIVARAMACSPSVLTRVPRHFAAVGYSPMERGKV